MPERAATSRAYQRRGTAGGAWTVPFAAPDSPAALSGRRTARADGHAIRAGADSPHNPWLKPRGGSNDVVRDAGLPGAGLVGLGLGAVYRIANGKIYVGQDLTGTVCLQPWPTKDERIVARPRTSRARGQRLDVPGHRAVVSSAVRPLTSGRCSSRATISTTSFVRAASSASEASARNFASSS